MNDHLDPAAFLRTRTSRPVLDVRAPGEYAHGHIPGARSFPLFSDAERAEVGTLYKQHSKEAALLAGLRIVGPNLERFVREANVLATDRKLAVHCWRGGQRSQSMAWLFRQAGFDVVTLQGGYKQYRQFVLQTFHDRPLQVIVLGGQTGSGKTKILHALRQKGEQIIDLEALAHHKGSAFGSIGEAPQPQVEQFENNLFDVFTQIDPGRRVWVENESRSIGRVFIPDGFWHQMKVAPLINIEVPLGMRIQNLVEDYAGTSVEDLQQAFIRIERKLGGQNLKAALQALDAGDFSTAATLALKYYDKTYRYGLDNNSSPDIRFLKFDTCTMEQIADRCIREVEERRPAGKIAVPLSGRE
ncbi:MAG: tRNA 2-selenouridine(34) synthase MnmH [Bacteroidetes bacterium]|nr:MAG: tRNA 2-selenouridine(34) synthase MnmH [Bacteroidota bacterium]